jgi:hypothetical protein
MEIISIEDLHPAVLSGASFGNPAVLIFRTRGFASLDYSRFAFIGRRSIFLILNQKTILLG